MKRRQTVLYMAPAVILIVAFFLGPLCYLGYVSFFEWNGLGPKTFVGIENFRYVFSDPVLKILLSGFCQPCFYTFPSGCFWRCF